MKNKHLSRKMIKEIIIKKIAFLFIRDPWARLEFMANRGWKIAQQLRASLGPYHAHAENVKKGVIHE